MAEVGTKKSINVVSKKNNEMCSVHSNNSLIDLDNISTSNNQLISLCDDGEDEDELILTNNTKNELSAEDKSLQELIENELALRICSSNEDGEEIEEEEEDSIKVQPEIKKIVLEPRQDPLDVNAEFIGAEINHYSVIEEPYGYQNGHTIEPDPKNQFNCSISSENLEDNFEQELVDFQNEELIVESESDISLDQSSKEVTEKEISSSDKVEESIKIIELPEEELLTLNGSDDAVTDVVDYIYESPKSTTSDKYLNEEEVFQSKFNEEDIEIVQESNFSDLPEADRKLTEFGDPWSNLESGDSMQSSHQISKFSDDFDHIPNQSQSFHDSFSSKTDVDSLSQSLGFKESDISSEILDVSRNLDLNEPISYKEASGVDEKDCSPNRDTCEAFLGNKTEENFKVEKIIDNNECLSDSTKTDVKTSTDFAKKVENNESRLSESNKIMSDNAQFGAINFNCTKLKPAQNDMDSWTTVKDATVGENRVESEVDEDLKESLIKNEKTEAKEGTPDLKQSEDKKNDFNTAPLATLDDESSEDSNAYDGDVSFASVLNFFQKKIHVKKICFVRLMKKQNFSF